MILRSALADGTCFGLKGKVLAIKKSRVPLLNQEIMIALKDFVDMLWTYKKATLRQLRNETGTRVKWVEAGETVLITKRSKPLLQDSSCFAC